MFFWNSLAFSMIQQVLAIWSLVPLPFVKPAGTSGSSRFTYCWSLFFFFFNFLYFISGTLLSVWPFSSQPHRKWILLNRWEHWDKMRLQNYTAGHWKPEIKLTIWPWSIVLHHYILPLYLNNVHLRFPKTKWQSIKLKRTLLNPNITSSIGSTFPVLSYIHNIKLPEKNSVLVLDTKILFIQYLRVIINDLIVYLFLDSKWHMDF